MKEFIYLYLTYKRFFLPIGAIIICSILFLLVIIPQLEGFFFLQNQLTLDKEKLRVLQENFTNITSLNDQDLESNFVLVTTVLPQEKDPVAILSSISHAASAANISLKDYSFEPGQLIEDTHALPVVVDLSTEGSLPAVQKFVQEITTGFPLASVVSVAVQSSNSASLRLMFYTKPVARTSFDKDNSVPLLTTKESDTLHMLKQWQ